MTESVTRTPAVIGLLGDTATVWCVKDRPMQSWCWKSSWRNKTPSASGVCITEYPRVAKYLTFLKFLLSLIDFDIPEVSASVSGKSPLPTVRGMGAGWLRARSNGECASPGLSSGCQ